MERKERALLTKPVLEHGWPEATQFKGSQVLPFIFLFQFFKPYTARLIICQSNEYSCSAGAEGRVPSLSGRLIS